MNVCERQSLSAMKRTCYVRSVRLGVKNKSCKLVVVTAVTDEAEIWRWREPDRHMLDVTEVKCFWSSAEWPGWTECRIKR